MKNIIAKSYINKEFKNSNQNEPVVSIIDNKTIIGTLSYCSKEDINLAFKGAKQYFNKNKLLPLDQRISYLKKMAEVLEENKEYLASLITNEIAKPYSDSLTEITRSIEFILQTIKVYEYETTHPLVFSSEVLKMDKEATYHLTPLGVVLCITPFNYPINLLIAKIAPAIICGNSVVIKPSAGGSLVTYEFIRLLDQKDIPSGLIQLLICKGATVGSKLYTNKNVDCVNFTGSTRVGLDIGKKVVLKPLILEMSGKDVAIVLKDVDIEKTAQEIVNGAFNFNGQRCTAIKRVLVDQSIAEQLIDSINQKVNALKCGDPFEKGVFITPTFNKNNIFLMQELIEDALKLGATSHQEYKVEKQLVHPVVLSNVTNKMKV